MINRSLRFLYNTYIILTMTIEELDHKTELMHDVISSNVKKYRMQKRVSQLQLALEIGLSGNAFIARAENRVKGAHFNIEHLVKISIILELNFQDLFIADTHF